MTTQQKIQDLFDNFFNFLVNDSELKGLATTEEKRILCRNFLNFLQEKNKRYGDSALNPIQIFSKSDASAQISNRLDDKLSRIKTSTYLIKNDLSDVFGYISLLLIQKDWIYFETINSKQKTQNVEVLDFEIFTNGNNKLIIKINNQLSLIKNSTELKKRDVHKLFELIAISLIENTWIEFSELID